MSQWTPWKDEDKSALFAAIEKYGTKWKLVMKDLPAGITVSAARNLYLRTRKKAEKKARKAERKQERNRLPGLTVDEYKDAMQTLDTERKEQLKNLRATVIENNKRIKTLSLQLDAVQARLLSLQKNEGSSC